MGRQRSFRSKAAHFVSDLTTVFLNPISDKPSKSPPHPPPPPSPPPDDLIEPKRSQLESITEEGSDNLIDGPDTSSFTAFLYSLLASSEPGNNSNSDGQNEYQAEMGERGSDTVTKDSGGKKSLLSKGKQSLSKAIYQAARIGGYRNQGLERKGNCDMKIDDGDGSNLVGVEMMRPIQTESEPVPWTDLPDISEPSLLLSEKTRSALYLSLPALVQGRKWVLLYSTWRHGISLSTLYRRSMLWPGLSLLVFSSEIFVKVNTKNIFVWRGILSMHVFVCNYASKKTTTTIYLQD